MESERLGEGVAEDSAGTVSLDGMGATVGDTAGRAVVAARVAVGKAGVMTGVRTMLGAGVEVAVGPPNPKVAAMVGPCQTSTATIATMNKVAKAIRPIINNCLFDKRLVAPFI